MKFIIDCDFDKEIVAAIVENKLPVTHIVIHAPGNPVGNGSEFMPEKLPTYEEFEEFTKYVLDKGLVPILGVDSTCQGNLEAHMDQYTATKSFFDKVVELGYKDVLVSSPNILGYIDMSYPELNIFLSYSQQVTSMNRARIFFELGANSIMIHPDIFKYRRAMTNFPKMMDKFPELTDRSYILPLNLGCNWGCIYWADHHNMQSHRTMNSPVYPDQANECAIKGAFDYPMLNCWKKRLMHPEEVLKSGWISPHDIDEYEALGYDTFLLLASGFSAEKVSTILRAYMDRKYDGTMNGILNIPKPYGNYWDDQQLENAMIQLEGSLVKEFCSNIPTNGYYPFEDDLNSYCGESVKKFNTGNEKQREEILSSLNEEIERIEKGVKI